MSKSSTRAVNCGKRLRSAIAAGLVAGDPQQIGMMLWAAVHGVVVLQLAGMLPPGLAHDLYHTLNATLARGLRPPA